MKQIGNLLRWIIYIPLVFIVFYLISLGFVALVWLVAKLGWFWVVLFLVTGIGLGAGLLQMLSSILSAGVMLVAPNQKAGGIIFSLLAIFWVIMGLIGMWSDSEFGIGFTILISLFYLGLWIPLIIVGITMASED